MSHLVKPTIRDRVVNLDEAAAILCVSKCTLMRLGKAGKIKILALSTRRRGVSIAEINRRLEEWRAA